MWSYQLRCRAVFHSRSAHMRSCTQPWQVIRAKLWASIRRRPSDERTTKERLLHELFCYTRGSSTPGTGVGMAVAGMLTVPVDHAMCSHDSPAAGKKAFRWHHGAWFSRRITVDRATCPLALSQWLRLLGCLHHRAHARTR